MVLPATFCPSSGALSSPDRSDGCHGLDRETIWVTFKKALNDVCHQPIRPKGGGGEGTKLYGELDSHSGAVLTTFDRDIISRARRSLEIVIEVTAVMVSTEKRSG
jgi:hypothetical protein